MDLKDRFILALLTDREKSQAFKLGEQLLVGKSTPLDAMKEAAGESSRAYGRNMLNISSYTDPLASAAEPVAKSVEALTEYGFGFFNAFVAQAVESTREMMGLDEPFAILVDRADISGMIGYYNKHRAELDKRYPEAAELMGLVKRRA